MSTSLFLDTIPPVAAEVGWGRLGVLGELGYEGGRVRVGGIGATHALSAHAPSAIEFELGGGFRSFQCRVAMNDDARQTRADFIVAADDRVVAVAPAVAAHEPPRTITAPIGGAHRLSLQIATRHHNFCHSVWLDPVVSDAFAIPLPDHDPLHRVVIRAPQVRPRAKNCITTVASASYASLLNDLLTSIERRACLDDTVIVVFNAGAAPDIAEVIAKHGAAEIVCDPIAPLDTRTKSVLYAAARVIDAERFLCLDTDILVTGDLRPIFSALDAAPPRAIFACRDAYLPQRLGDTLTGFYGGSAGDLARLLVHPEGEERFDFVVNDGVFAARREGMMALDSFLRDLPAAVPWMDEPRQNRGRNQFLFNLALARMECGVELDPTCNLQLHMRDLRIEHRGARAEAMWAGRDVRILHFCGWGRGKHADLRTYFAG
jgi:hypothetical protein